MKQQTFIVCLEDENSRTIDFERFADKQLKTVQRKIIELYTTGYWIYKNQISKSHHLTIYATPDGYNQKIKQTEISKAELLRLIGQTV